MSIFPIRVHSRVLVIMEHIFMTVLSNYELFLLKLPDVSLFANVWKVPILDFPYQHPFHARSLFLLGNVSSFLCTFFFHTTTNFVYSRVLSVICTKSYVPCARFFWRF